MAIDGVLSLWIFFDALFVRRHLFSSDIQLFRGHMCMNRDDACKDCWAQYRCQKRKRCERPHKMQEEESMIASLISLRPALLKLGNFHLQNKAMQINREGHSLHRKRSSQKRGRKKIKTHSDGSLSV